MLARPAPPPSSSIRARARRFLWRRRYLLAAVCVAAAVAITLEAVRPAPPPTEPAVVVTGDVPAGTRLTSSDVAVRDVPAQALPDRVLPAIDDAVGRHLAVGLGAGTALQPAMLIGPGLSASAPPGTVVVPVPVADDATAQLARPGQRLDLVAPAPAGAEPSGDAARVVARDVVVLARAAGSGGGGLLGNTRDMAHYLYVAADESDATVLVGSGAWALLRAVLPRQ